MGYVLGIDIGGTKIATALYDSKTLLSQKEEVFPTSNNVMKQVLEIVGMYNKKKLIKVIGIASAGRIDSKRGRVIYVSKNLNNWSGQEVKKIIEEQFSIPCYVDNDVNCAAHAEYQITGSTGTLFFISLGTGVGGAFIFEGGVVHGKNYATGELGHVTLYPDGEKCHCGKCGCTERYISGRAISGQISGGNQGRYAEKKEILAEFSKEDSDIKNSFIQNLGMTIINIQNLIDPDVIVIGGGLGNSADFWLADLRKYLSDNTTLNIELRTAQLKNDSGVYGAALLAQQNHEPTNDNN